MNTATAESEAQERPRVARQELTALGALMWATGFTGGDATLALGRLNGMGWELRKHPPTATEQENAH